MTTRWGFLATGAVAARVAGDLALTEGAVPLAVASRDGARAEEFADRHGFGRSYGSYAELVADPEVDVVYVATPHAQHHAAARLALEAGKAVLCEKPLTASAAAAHDLAALARERRTFLMESMRTRFQPVVVRLRALLADGAIGRLRSVRADIGSRADVDDGHRLLDPGQGGGALLDVGVYPVSFAQMLLGAPSSVAVTGSLARTGVDAEASLLLGWPDGEQALLSCTLLAPVARTAELVGTGGRIELAASFQQTPRLVVHRAGREAEVVEAPYRGAGYVDQLEHVQSCLAAGLLESPVMPLADTLAVAQVLDEALDGLGATHRDEGFTAAGRVHGLHHTTLAIPAGAEEACRAFYVGALGMREVPKPAAMAAAGGCWFRGRRAELHLSVEPGFRPQRTAHPGLLVTDLDALAAHLARHGVEVTWDEDLPGHRRFYAVDPAGNRLELLAPVR